MHQRRKFGRLTLLITMLLFGFASAQKVIQLLYCSLDDNHLIMDCKYSLPAESPEEVFCTYTQGEKLLDTSEEELPPNKKAKVRFFSGNICRLRYNNLPSGKSTFTCNIKLGNSTATKTSVVEKKLLLPCSAWSVLLQSCSGLLLTLMVLPMLLEIYGL